MVEIWSVTTVEVEFSEVHNEECGGHKAAGTETKLRKSFTSVIHAVQKVESLLMA